jgi:hypothetical protein
LLLSLYPSCSRTLPFAPQARTASTSSVYVLSSTSLSGETDINPIGAMGKVRISLKRLAAQLVQPFIYRLLNWFLRWWLLAT